jgi:hypothetical protein
VQVKVPTPLGGVRHRGTGAQGTNIVDLLSLGDIKEVGVAVAEKKNRGVIGLVPLLSSQGELPDCICYVFGHPIA